MNEVMGFSNVTPRSLVDGYKRFRESCCPQLHGGLHGVRSQCHCRNLKSRILLYLWRFTRTSMCSDSWDLSSRLAFQWPSRDLFRMCLVQISSGTLRFAKQVGIEVTFQRLIPNVFGSDLFRDTGYFDWGSSCFPQFLQQMPIEFVDYVTPASLQSIPSSSFIHLLIIRHFIVCFAK
jgi:hypothetical protein